MPFLLITESMLTGPAPEMRLFYLSIKHTNNTQTQIIMIIDCHQCHCRRFHLQRSEAYWTTKQTDGGWTNSEV